MLIDIHTHRCEIAEDTLAIINTQSWPQGKGLYSVGIHPWEASEPTTIAKLNDMCVVAQSQQIVAIGEIGLDKSRNPDLSTQIELFTTQIKIANTLKKPIIIHCVRAYNELINLKSTIETPAIIHGFRGKPELAISLIRHGFFLSFGSKRNEETVNAVPSGTFFLETDTEGDIKQIYHEVASQKEIPQSQLEEEIYKSFKNIFQK